MQKDTEREYSLSSPVSCGLRLMMPIIPSILLFPPTFHPIRLIPTRARAQSLHLKHGQVDGEPTAVATRTAIRYKPFNRRQQRRLTGRGRTRHCNVAGQLARTHAHTSQIRVEQWGDMQQPPQGKWCSCHMIYNTT